jgi:hypothetical protein
MGSTALAASPTRSDTIVAAAGASAALAGLILVFLGVVIAGYQAYPGGTPKRLLKPYRKATAAILAVFALNLACAGLSLIWLMTGGGEGLLYQVVLGTFLASLVGIFTVACLTTYRVVLT